MAKDNNFFPDDYAEIEQKEKDKTDTNGYMRFVEGNNTFRVLTKPIIGWVWWIDSNGEVVERGSKAQKGNKPVRIDTKTNMQVEEYENAKLFWIMQVWNYDENKAQILEVTQISVRDGMKGYINDKDWGDPQGYDFVVERTDGERVSYSVRAKPHKAFDRSNKDIPEVNLSALYEGEDPYKFKVNDFNMADILGEISEEIDLER